jgi:chromosome segregation ATPase
VRRQLTTAGYILVGKCGTVQITPEGRAKLQSKTGLVVTGLEVTGLAVTGLAVTGLAVTGLGKASKVSTGDSEIIKLREAIAEHEQLLLLSAEEEAVNTAAVQGIMSQIPAVRTKLAQVQRELDTLTKRQNAVEAKIAQSKKDQDDLRREIDNMSAQIPILEQVLN